MSTHPLLPLTAAALFALCAGSMVLSNNARHAEGAKAAITASSRVDARPVSVGPKAEPLADDQAHRHIVDLAAITVLPDLADLAYYQAAQGAERVVTLAAVAVRPAATDLAWYVSHQAGQIAAANASALRDGANQFDAQLAAGAGRLVREAAAR